MKKEVVYHIIFWILYLLLWSAQDYVYFNDYTAVLLRNAITIPSLLAIAYINVYVLLPKFLFKKKYHLYLGFLLVSILLTTFTYALNHYAYFTYFITNKSMGDFFMSTQGMLALLTEILVLVGFSMSIFLLRERYYKEKILEEIQKKKLEIELKSLKEQMNPHFLFNSLNSIYMMLDKDLDKGKEMLLRFSDMLSHQIYEVSQDLIPLEKEIEHLKNYIGIESIRHNNLATIETDIMEYKGGLKISPMILLSLIENAFKHSLDNEPYQINIKLSLNSENHLILETENSIANKSKNDSSGIGLANVKRRLSLIYPEKHELELKKEKARFKVILKITLDD